MATANNLTPEPVGVWITPTLEADYIRRGVFPHLRIKEAKHKNGNQGLLEVSVEDARAIYKDAAEQRSRGRNKANRGVTIAYCALENRLRSRVAEKREEWTSQSAARVLEEARALGGDGLDAIRREGRLAQALLDVVRSSPALFHVGDLVICASDGEPLVVSREFCAFTVNGGSHPRLGYVAKDEDGKEHFYPAWQLTKLNRKPAHLRLVGEVIA
jgi:hypothetical protein